MPRMNVLPPHAAMTVDLARVQFATTTTKRHLTVRRSSHRGTLSRWSNHA
jgi:hypothetical protein